MATADTEQLAAEQMSSPTVTNRENEPITAPQGLPGVIGIEEFEAQARAEDVLNEQLKASSATKRSISGTSSLSATTNSTPVPIGKPRTSEHIIKFTQLCQQRCFSPDFQYEEPAPQKFRARVSFAGVVVEEPGLFASKKEAKEAVAARTLEIARGINPANAQENGKEEREGNWIGLLLEFSNATSAPTPVYQDYALGRHFACECTIPQRALPFGSKDEGHASKKAARATAARAAVLWLRQHGHLPPAGAPPPRKKAKTTAPSSPPSSFSSLASPLTDTTTITTDPSAAGANANPKSAPQLVAEKCLLLGLSSPEYRFEAASAAAPGFLSGAAWFVRDPGVASGPVGEVRHVYGKKAAREECARGVLAFLEGLEEERRRVLEGVLAGRGGGE